MSKTKYTLMHLFFKTLQAFLTACYNPGDLPLKSPPDIVSKVGAVASKVKVRTSSKELQQLQMPSVQQSAGSSAQQPAGSSNMGMNDFMSMGCKLMGLIMEQAKALDALQGRMPKPDAMGKSSSSTSLASHSSECSLLTPKALPATSEPAHGDPPLLALPAPPAHETNHEKGDAEKASHDNDQSQGKSLEEYEKEAMQKGQSEKGQRVGCCGEKTCLKKGLCQSESFPKVQSAEAGEDEAHHPSF
jgi:hypothetical protein